MQLQIENTLVEIGDPAQAAINCLRVLEALGGTTATNPTQDHYHETPLMLELSTATADTPLAIA